MSHVNAHTHYINCCVEDRRDDKPASLSAHHVHSFAGVCRAVEAIDTHARKHSQTNRQQNDAGKVDLRNERKYTPKFRTIKA